MKPHTCIRISKIPEAKDPKRGFGGNILRRVGQISLPHAGARDPHSSPFQWHLRIGTWDFPARAPRRIAVSGSSADPPSQLELNVPS